MHITRLLPLLVLVAALLPGAAHAAQDYDNCTGYIDSLPTTIATQGTWCLRKDLATSMASGYAITIGTNNVTIDCNDFKIGGLAAGPQTLAYGIFANSRLNATVRRCNLRGFYSAINLVGIGAGGHLVEDNRIEAGTKYGLNVEGDGSRVQRNLVRDTGGHGDAYGLRVAGDVDVRDNTVAGVAPLTANSGAASAIGILTYQNQSGTLRGNRVRGLVPLGAAPGYGIQNLMNGRILVQGNQLVGSGAATSYGVTCTYKQGRVRGNIVNGFSHQGYGDCLFEQGGNDYTP